jgi:drug/metabolite transporter (DMT)-like permease
LQFNSFGADSIVLIAASVFGLFSVLSKQANNETFSVTVYFFLSATIFSALTMLLTSHFVIPEGAAWLPILINGPFINGLSYVLWLQALKYGDASFVAPFVFLTPVIAAFLIVFLFHEPLLPAYLFGLGTVILSGLIAVSHSLYSNDVVM